NNINETPLNPLLFAGNPSSPTAPPPASSSPTSSSRRPVQSLSDLYQASTRQPTPQQKPSSSASSALAETASAYRASDLATHFHRRFRHGDIYAPHDLSPTEQQKFRARRAPPRDTPLPPSAKSKRQDAFDVLNIHPLTEYKNFAMMSAEFVTSMGRIKGRRETGLRGVNQRRVAKAVRRAVGMGLVPSVHRHPEMLEREAQEMARRRGRGAGGGDRVRAGRRY
ncbi:MAG: hypothetical protein LQ338_008188, partial [Usnochroma carphineum]